MSSVKVLVICLPRSLESLRSTTEMLDKKTELGDA
jgi:hypothetical protein